MKQKQYAPMSIAEMAVSIYAANEGFLDDIALNKILSFEKGLHVHFHGNYSDLMKKIVDTGDWNKDIEEAFKKGISEFKKTGSW
jgi:F-type H+-transporting ATPase subunit alpha